MARLYILGARQKKRLVRQEEEWNLYETALILELDTETGQVMTCVEYTTPEDARSTEQASHVFKAGARVGNALYTCTSTEVLTFRLPEFERIGYVSLPAFNDLHHVTQTSDGNLVAVSTGLDMVIKFTPQGDVITEWPVLEEPLWTRFSQDVDYRRVASTKPHQSHPNFIFELDGELWVTRFAQRDAICLTTPGRRIDVAVQRPHDGLVCGERIFFTTVDGNVVIANRRTLQVDQVVDLKLIDGQETLLGWCRGLLPVEEHRTWVAFTRVRKTNLQENILWIKNALHAGMPEKSTHISLYDLSNQQCLAEFDLEPHGLNVIFGILPADTGTKPGTT